MGAPHHPYYHIETPMNASEARAIAEEPMYLKLIRRQADLRMFECELEAITRDDMLTIRSALGELGYSCEKIRQKSENGFTWHTMMVRW